MQEAKADERIIFKAASDDFNFIPLWQLVYGDVITCHPFLSDVDFATRNARMAVGGIVAPAAWNILGKEDGKRGRIYAETTQQKAMRRLMLLFAASWSVIRKLWLKPKESTPRQVH